MTYEEAHDILENQQREYTTHRDKYPEELITANGKAIEALEMLIPRKLIQVNRTGEIDGNWVRVCPRCSRVVVERITTGRGSYPIWHQPQNWLSCRCGQRIDGEGK